MILGGLNVLARLVLGWNVYKDLHDIFYTSDVSSFTISLHQHMPRTSNGHDLHRNNNRTISMKRNQNETQIDNTEHFNGLEVKSKRVAYPQQKEKQYSISEETIMQSDLRVYRQQNKEK